MPAHRKADAQTALMVKTKYRPYVSGIRKLSKETGLNVNVIRKMVQGITYKEIR